MQVGGHLSDLAALRARAQGPSMRRLSFRSPPYGAGNSVKTSDIMNLYVRLSMVTSWRAQAAQLLCTGNLCAVPWRHAAPSCRPSAAHMRPRGWCTITGHCMAPFPCRPDPDLASLQKGRAHQQHTVQERVEGWAAVTGTHKTYWWEAGRATSPCPQDGPLTLSLTDEPSSRIAPRIARSNRPRCPFARA